MEIAVCSVHMVQKDAPRFRLVKRAVKISLDRAIYDFFLLINARTLNASPGHFQSPIFLISLASLGSERYFLKDGYPRI
jgi:hypothetical protein